SLSKLRKRTLLEWNRLPSPTDEVHEAVSRESSVHLPDLNQVPYKAVPHEKRCSNSVCTKAILPLLPQRYQLAATLLQSFFLLRMCLETTTFQRTSDVLFFQKMQPENILTLDGGGRAIIQIRIPQQLEKLTSLAGESLSRIICRSDRTYALG